MRNFTRVGDKPRAKEGALEAHLVAANSPCVHQLRLLYQCTECRRQTADKISITRETRIVYDAMERQHGLFQRGRLTILAL